jgi:hypothetical protein
VPGVTATGEKGPVTVRVPLQAGRVSQRPTVAASAGRPEPPGGHDTRAGFFWFVFLSSKKMNKKIFAGKKIYGKIVLPVKGKGFTEFRVGCIKKVDPIFIS